ncbi:hypothetical protein GE061_003131 [Apolygus lucorum]|uniref:Uncharacterized protein n=1 Tax=Apolygus lucorum TaxID=248454 RepID=A0A6A4JC63_APOLU|nr:hypothetical protein GE061_003131 [Apolygus lucorum]
MVQPVMPEPSLRGARLFRAIGRRLAKQEDEDSADSESSSESGTSSTNTQNSNTLRRMMASLSIRSPSRSSSKKILRQPITYTYMKGMSGLPTIRVPKAGSMRQ